MAWFALIVLLVAAFVALSHLVEVLRRYPETPPAPTWLPEGSAYGMIDVGGMRLRRLRAGSGPPVLLLHTLRTQIELFRDVVPNLAKDFEVHAFDFPGHGYSDIPPGPYGPEIFAAATRAYLEKADLREVTVVGESIGGAIGLLLAAEQNPRIARVVAINSYDYDNGSGITRGSTLSWLLFNAPRVPLLGPSLWRIRWPGIFAEVIKGSVHHPERLDPALVRHIHDVGNRPGHCEAFISLIRNFPAWEALRGRYKAIGIPVLLVYGSEDWSHDDEREAVARLIPKAELVTVEGAGHLMSFDDPGAVIAATRSAAGR
jgi:pimeloyl-ACP methyl ester carboxylesterase